jgi:integrase
VHGFRSTFRDWAAEVANAPREVAEKSLAHTVGSDVERAYARSDLLEKRRSLMNDWSKFVTSGNNKGQRHETPTE